MANGTIAFDTLSTSGQISGTAKSVDTDYLAYGSAKVWYGFDLHEGKILLKVLLTHQVEQTMELEMQQLLTLITWIALTTYLLQGVLIQI